MKRKEKEEIVVYAETLEEATKYLNNLIVNSGRFMNGGYPCLCKMGSNDVAFKRKVGMESFDHQVRYRIDWDPQKGVHFNYEDFLGVGDGPFVHDYKVCIVIGNMTREQYIKYINSLNKGLPEIKDVGEVEGIQPKRSEYAEHELPVTNFEQRRFQPGVSYMFRRRTRRYEDISNSELSDYIAANPTYLSSRRRSA